MFSKKHYLLLPLCVLNLGFVFAQSPLDSLQRLQEVVITAKPFQEIIPAQTLTGQQLKALNSHSVADALRYFAGIQIKDYGGMGGLKTIDVRNMGSAHVGVFYNGIAIGNAQNGTVDLGKFSLDDVEQISLYNGQKSEIFQSAKDFSSASSVYIRAKRSQFEEKKNTNLTLRHKEGTIETHNPSFRLEQRVNKQINFSLSGEYLTSPGKYKFHFARKNIDGTTAHDTTAYRKNSDIEYYRVESSVFTNFNKGGLLETNFYYYQSDRGLPGAIVKKKFHSGEHLIDKSFFAQSIYTKDFSDRYKLQAKAKFAYDYTHYTSRDTISVNVSNLGEQYEASMIFDNSYYQQNIYTSIINSYKITPTWDVALAIDFDYHKLNASFRNKAGVNDTLTYGTPFSFPQRYSLIAALSSSLDLDKLKVMASVVANYTQESVRNNTKSPDKKEFTPAIFLGYKPFQDHDLNFRAFYKRIFRMPTFNDLYYAQIGYSLLRPEYTHQINLGFTYHRPSRQMYIPSFSLQADAYYMHVKDKIIAAPTGSMFRWMMTNMGKVEGHGVDVVAKLDSRIEKMNIAATFSYAYSVARDYTKGADGLKLSSYGDQIPYTPWHTASAILSGSYRTWALNYSFIYICKRYNGAVNNIAANEIQPWYTHDMSVQKEFRVKAFLLKGSVEANNIFDQYYEVVLNYPMPGRNFRFILSINI